MEGGKNDGNGGMVIEITKSIQSFSEIKSRNQIEEDIDMNKPNNEELEALKNRVRLGNSRLNSAWDQIRAMVHNTEEWDEEVERWHHANNKLSLLCDELKLKYDYHECLYLDSDGKKTKLCLPPGDDIGCRVCSSKREYWSEELMDLPGPKVKQSERGKEAKEFMIKLGEEI